MTPTQTRIKDAAAEFLALRRIAVTGVSANPQGHGANLVYKRLRERGYEVFAVNPNAQQVEGDPAYPSLHDIPGGVDGVVIATAAERAPATMSEIVELGIRYAWMHSSGAKPNSVSAEAAGLGRANGVTVIDGACPLMFGAASDPGHRIMCRMLSLTRRIPRTV